MRLLNIASWLLLSIFGTALAPGAASREPLPFVKGSYRDMLRAHAGQPIIVHIWGLSCGPCLAELPEWGRIAAERPHVKIVLINADRPDLQAGKRIDATLAKMGLGKAESYAFADRFEDRLRFEIDADWQGELPRSIMIAANGKATTLAGVADMAAVRAWMDATAK